MNRPRRRSHAHADVLLAEALQGAGDDAAAAVEREEAERTLTALGATTQPRRVGSVRHRGSPPGGLTARELEVLARVVAPRRPSSASI